MTDDLELPQAERRALAEFKRDLSPPDDSEARIVDALRARGVIRRRVSPMQWAAAAALLILVFSAGVWSGRPASQRNVARGPRFVLLLYGGDSSAGSDRHREYATWARTMASRGIDVDGEELATEQIELPQPGWAPATTQAPGGYFIVSASTIEEARQIASTCPHLQHGGRIVIRPIAAAR
jgi:hypothetical protein